MLNSTRHGSVGSNGMDIIQEPSYIQEFYSGSTVLVTGATGIVGRLIVEKLLRTCKSVEKIYVLFRQQKEKGPEQRLKEYFDDPLYEPLKKENPTSLNKVAVLKGDCFMPNLGLSDIDERTIIQEVNSIFHCAGMVKLNAKLRDVAYTNVRGTKDLLDLARKMNDLKSFIFVSTAFSFSPRRNIDEVFYEPPMTGDKLITLVETLNDDKLQKITPTIIQGWPNTYSFTKAIAENVIKMEGVGLPIGIVRPSIIVTTLKEPIGGWTNNMRHGVVGVWIGTGLGIVRTVHMNRRCLSEIVPADYVVNAIIAAAWDVGKKSGIQFGSETSNTDIQIYNYVNGPQKPITWGQCKRGLMAHNDSAPYMQQVWYQFHWQESVKLFYLLAHYSLHLIPAYVIDGVSSLGGRDTGLVNLYKNIDKLLMVLAPLCNKQWTFSNKNTQQLWKKLNEEDRKAFEFNMADMDWDSYFYSFTRGVRVHLLKDPLSTIPEAHAKRAKLRVAHYTLSGALIWLFLCLVWKMLF